MIPLLVIVLTRVSNASPILRGNSIILAMSLSISAVRGDLLMEFFHVIFQHLTFQRRQLSALVREAE